jgi:hypothetical protein
MTIKTRVATVWTTSDGKEFLSEEAALLHQGQLDQLNVLNELDVYWRDTGPEEVARKLTEAGYRIVPK